MAAVILVGVSLSLFAVLGGVFRVPMRGSLPLFYFVTILCIFANAGLGLFAATMLTEQAQLDAHRLWPLDVDEDGPHMHP